MSAFHSTKKDSFGNFIPNSPFYSGMEVMGVAQWVGISSWAQKSLKTKIQVCDVDGVERRFHVEKEELCLLFNNLN